MADNLSQPKIIYLNQFKKCDGINEVLSALYFMNFSQGKMSYSNYFSREGEITPVSLDELMGDHKITAKANRFPIRLENQVQDEEKNLEEGYIFEGMLWLQPKEFSSENYGFGGKIFCWAPQKIENLRMLIYGDATTPEQIAEINSQIKRGYRQQIINQREEDSETRTRQSKDAASNALWRARHGCYPESTFAGGD